MGPVRSIDLRRSTRGRPRPTRARLPILRRLRRDPAAIRHWLAVAIAAALLVSLVDRAVGDAERTRHRWGRTTAVWVATEPIRAGDDLAGAVRSARWPAALVPDAALEADPGDARAAGPLDRGSIVTSALVAPDDDRGRTVAVPLPEAHLPVEAGDRVDVWATADPATVADGADGTERVARDARVVQAGRSSVVLEVDEEEVDDLAAAGSTATLTLVGAP